MEKFNEVGKLMDDVRKRLDEVINYFDTHPELEDIDEALEKNKLLEEAYQLMHKSRKITEEIIRKLKEKYESKY